MRISNDSRKYGQEGQYVGPPKTAMSEEDRRLLREALLELAKYLEAQARK